MLNRYRSAVVVSALVSVTAYFIIYTELTTNAYIYGKKFLRPGNTSSTQRLSMALSPTITDSPKRQGFVRHNFAGRLGNVLFQYASIYCIAKQSGLVPLFLNNNEAGFLRDPGPLVSKEIFDRTTSRRILFEKRCCSLDDELKMLPPGENYTVYGYLQSWKYFEPCKEDLKRIFVFKDTYVEQAESAITALRERFQKQTLVGIHIRMEDHNSSRARKAGKRLATPQYFLKAMTYFRDRFSDVIFVVITSKQEWWLTHVTRSPDVTFLARSHPAVDMEILSRLDHLIISVGTFGWWAAYRNIGTVVCFSNFSTPGTHFAKQFVNNAGDHLYPEWIRM